MSSNKGGTEIVEKWLGMIPGIGTYRKRENLRETDHNLRAYLAKNLKEVKAELEKIVLDFSLLKKFDLLTMLEEVISQLQQIADTIKYANYGYGGIFALKKIREEELKKLYDFDLALVTEVKKVREIVEEMSKNSNFDFLTNKVKELKEFLNALEKKLGQRHDFLIKPD